MDFDTGRRVQGEAVILLGGETGEPFRVLSWRDDFDGPT
jgi:general secretion pathway protein K